MYVAVRHLSCLFDTGFETEVLGLFKTEQNARSAMTENIKEFFSEYGLGSLGSITPNMSIAIDRDLIFTYYGNNAILDGGYEGYWSWDICEC